MQFQDLMVYYDGTELMPKMMNLTQFDLIDIKGVFNILSLNKLSTCSGIQGIKILNIMAHQHLFIPLSHKIKRHAKCL